jgi:hypothetical protein
MAMTAGLDAALVRWSVVVRTWQELQGGGQPALGPFLAGWFLRQISNAERAPNAERFESSFRAGWKESEMHLAILLRQGDG